MIFLMWVLVSQAEEAGVVMDELPADLRKVDMPIIHENGTYFEGNDGRMVLVDGGYKVRDEELEGYGVPPRKPWDPEFEQRLYEQTGIVPTDQDRPALRDPRRIPESSDGKLVTVVEMSRYCDFLESQKIITEGKYLRYCRGQ